MAQFLKRMIDRFRRALLWLWSQEGTPGQRARGLAAGVFAGCFPLFGFQTFLGVLFANLLRGNTFLAVVGTWISNPMTYLQDGKQYIVVAVGGGGGAATPELIALALP